MQEQCNAIFKTNKKTLKLAINSHHFSGLRVLRRLAVRLGAVQQHPWQHTCANFCTDMHYWITVKQRAKTRVKHQAARGAQWLWDMQAAPAEPLPQPPWRELKGNSSQPWLVACLTV